MSNIVPFTSQSPLSPFLGQWYLDPLSVSRNKVTKRILGADNLKMLWAIGSMCELINAIQSSVELQEKYRQLLQYDRGSSMVITPQTISICRPEHPLFPAESIIMPVLSITKEGSKVVVKTTWRSNPCDHVLRMNKEWLLMTERMQTVPQLTHRYHRDKVQLPGS